jgi:hypothetical protein
VPLRRRVWGPSHAPEGDEKSRPCEGAISMNSRFRLRDTTHVEVTQLGGADSPGNLLGSPRMTRRELANSGMARVYVNCI